MFSLLSSEMPLKHRLALDYDELPRRITALSARVLSWTYRVISTDTGLSWYFLMDRRASSNSPNVIPSAAAVALAYYSTLSLAMDSLLLRASTTGWLASAGRHDPAALHVAQLTGHSLGREATKSATRVNGCPLVFPQSRHRVGAEGSAVVTITISRSSSKTISCPPCPHAKLNSCSPARADHHW